MCSPVIPSRLADRQKRRNRDDLLAGVQLPQTRTADDTLLEAREPPSAPVQHGHAVMEFHEPENQEGEAVIRQRRSARGQTAVSVCWAVAQHTDTGSNAPAPFPPWYQVGWPPYQPSPQPQFPSAWSQPPPPPAANPPTQPESQPPLAANPLSQPPAAAHSGGQDRRRERRRQKAAVMDQQLMAQGQPPKKRPTRTHYDCATCGQAKNKTTGHTQLKGKWYCPHSGLTLEDWKSALNL